VNALTDDLQAAVDDTNSPTLSGNLVTRLDSFRRGVESITRGAGPGGRPDPATLRTAQTQLRSSMDSLAGMLVQEMDGLLRDRLDRLDLRRLDALVAAGAAVLLALGAVAVGLTGRRRFAMPRPSDEATRDMSVRPSGGTPGYANVLDPGPSSGEGTPKRRERSGALR
jgi:hypothetical protein